MNNHPIFDLTNEHEQEQEHIGDIIVMSEEEKEYQYTSSVMEL